MDKQKKNEEIQSRREFFKKAAKSALPVVGAVVLSSVPFADAAAQFGCGCGYSCSNSCYTSCGSGCGFGCQNTCKGGCGGCKGVCQNSCTRSSFY